MDVAPALEGLAAVVAAQREPMWAARLWGAAEAQREVYSLPLEPVYRSDYEQAVAAARTQLGEQSFAAAWAEGRSMTPEQALAATGSSDSPCAASGNRVREITAHLSRRTDGPRSGGAVPGGTGAE